MLIVEAVNIMENIDLTKKKRNIIKHRNLLSHIKMNKEILRFVGTEIKKKLFYYHKSPFFEKNVDIEELLVTNKTSSEKKL